MSLSDREKKRGKEGRGKVVRDTVRERVGKVGDAVGVGEKDGVICENTEKTGVGMDRI